MAEGSLLVAEAWILSHWVFLEANLLSGRLLPERSLLWLHLHSTVT